MHVLAVVLACLACSAVEGQTSAGDSISNRFDPGLQAAALGAADAPVVMVEFVDYRCGFCARQARAAFDQIRERYIEPGLVRYLAIELPLLGPEAERDAAAARCAGEQGGYWAAYRALLIEAELPREGPLDLAALAEAKDLDQVRLSECVASGRQLDALKISVARATAHRVDGTPTFFFGYPIAGEDALTIERHLAGAAGVAPAIEAIEALLGSLRERQQRIRTDR